jgi:hypothetical protein
MLPVAENVAACADAIVQRIANDETLVDCNPRSPYLFLTWLLIGDDNFNRVNLNVEIDQLEVDVAILLLRLALGDTVCNSEIRTFIKRIRRFSFDDMKPADVSAYRGVGFAACSACRYALDGDIAKASHDALRAVHVTVYELDTFLFFREKLLQWEHISDEEAFIIARQLLFDIVDLKS